jgi:hypothetical protein
MARRVFPLVLMIVFGAATAQAATPFDAFARLIDGATGPAKRSATATRPDSAAVLKTAPLPNLRPAAPAPTATGNSALPAATAAYAPAPAPSAAAKAPFDAVAAPAALSQPSPVLRTAPANASNSASASAAKQASEKSAAPASAPVATASLSGTAVTKPAATPAAAPVTTAALQAPAAVPQKSTPPAAAAASEPEKPLPTPSALPKIPAEGTTSCAIALAAFGLKATAAPGLGEGECRVAAPVTITNVGEIALSPKALVDCATAATVAVWLRDTVAPKAEAIVGAKLTAIRVLDTYNCRTANNVKGANLSEHARGRAIDIGAFKVGDRWITVGGKDLAEADQKFLDAIRTSACGPFTTVLGPGSDAAHHDHFHLDLASRQTAGPSRGLYCH